MAEANLQFGPSADEAEWRALVERGLKGAGWDRLVGRTADGIDLKPLYREPDVRTASDEAGLPGTAPFVRGTGGWTIRQSFAHPDPEQTNREILADFAGGVGGIELIIDPSGADGVAIRNAADLDLALADVILEAAPVSLDATTGPSWDGAHMLRDKLKGVAAPGTAFNIDPIGMLMRSGAIGHGDIASAARFALDARRTLPAATSIRIDARPVHEGGGTEAQEIAAALAAGISYLRALTQAGLSCEEAARSLAFSAAVGPDVLVEAAKLRALRLCWARVLEASGAAPEARGARIHAVTSRRMMTRYDAHTNILRVTTAAFAAGIGGAESITTLPFTDALGLPTPFARRVARNTQLVLKEESHLDHVADPAGGAWFVEKLTRDLAELAWAKMQGIEAQGGIVAVLASGALQKDVAEARAARQAAFARCKETITGVTDFPLLGQDAPEIAAADPRLPLGSHGRQDAGGPTITPLPAIRWAAPFESLRERAEGSSGANVFFATLGPHTEFSQHAQFALNLLAVGGVGALGAESEYAAFDALIGAFKQSGARVAVLVGAEARYVGEAESVARALKQASASWIVLAGKPGEREAALRASGVDQFVYAGQDMLKELESLHAALGVA